MKRLLLKFIGILLVNVILISTINQVNAAEYKLNVTKYSQEKSNWCWVACAKMLGKYYGRSYSQSQICKHVKNKVVNETASLSQLTSAIRYATKKSVLQGGVAKFNGFVINMKAKNPAVLRMGWNAGGGHVYVVAGLKEAKGIRLDSLYLIDPIKGRSSGYYGYAGLVNGMTLASGTGRYTHTWSLH